MQTLTYANLIIVIFITIFKLFTRGFVEATTHVRRGMLPYAKNPDKTFPSRNCEGVVRGSDEPMARSM
jgi:hypothetical protein